MIELKPDVQSFYLQHPCFAEGARAFWNGDNRNDNPYLESSEKVTNPIAWYMGYDTAVSIGDVEMVSDD